MPLKRHVDQTTQQLPPIVAAYVDAGWTGTLPLPRGEKHSPPSGFTGRYDDPASHEALWEGTRGEFNLALRCPVGVIGIDVDTYGDKEGYAQLQKLMGQYGSLPDTYVSSSRPNPKQSGIRWFRVPDGVAFNGNIARDIEVIQRHHRYAVAYPSVVEGRPYQWFHTGGDFNHLIPALHLLPELPKSWVDGLSIEGKKKAKTRNGLSRHVVSADRPMTLPNAQEKLRRCGDRFYATMPGDSYNSALFGFSKDVFGFSTAMGMDDDEAWELLCGKVRVHPAYGHDWDDIDEADEATMRSGAESYETWAVLPDDSPTQSSGGRLLHRMKTPTIEVVDYLWKGGILAGAITLLAGPPGTGKSTFTYALAAEVTQGTVQGDFYGEPGIVVICSTEDSPSKAIVPRLTAHGADFNRILWVELGEGFTFPDDVEKLREEIKELDEPVRLMIFDPLVNRLSNDTNTYKDSDVRKALEPLQTMAEEEGVSVLGIMHNNKATDADPLNAISGAVAFGGVARAVLALSKADDYEETGERTIGVIKNNYGSDTIPAYRYRIESVEMDPTVKHRKGKKATTSRIVWVKKSDNTQSQEISSRKRTERQQREEVKDGHKAEQKDNAKDWILSYLLDGPKSRGQIDHDADRATGGPSRATVGRALKEMKDNGQLKATPGGVWELPSVSFQDAIERLGELPDGTQLPGHPYGGVARYQPTPAGIEVIRHYAERTGDSTAVDYLVGFESTD